ncbi:MAG TPA: tellurite resistance/C4-dicarboxylate transporter family protein [Syntrophales bacterium]|nr:tellurite resistance/C4-dicarboxylate transporter family protein [Syntrophales bacterium]
MAGIVKDLYPGYFALVMATGIVSVSASLLDMVILADVLFFINVCSYCVLILFTVARLCRYFSLVLRDLTRHQSGPGFFTTIAGTCVLGSQYVILFSEPTIGFFFWVLGACLWLVLMYTFFAAIIIRQVKPSIETGLHGGWLVIVVSTQSLSVLGMLAAPGIPVGEQMLLFVSLALYLLGCAMYMTFIALIFYRLLFFTLAPEAFTPTYWVNMGAIAITTLAGSLLIQEASASIFLQETLPFLRGFTLFFWVAATWWIPLLIILELWRHIWKRIPVHYDPEYWNIVFPLGMYTAATFTLGRATGYGFLEIVSRGMFYLAVAAWIVTFAALVQGLLRSLIITFPEGNRHPTKKVKNL